MVARLVSALIHRQTTQKLGLNFPYSVVCIVAALLLFWNDHEEMSKKFLITNGLLLYTNLVTYSLPSLWWQYIRNHCSYVDAYCPSTQLCEEWYKSKISSVALYNKPYEGGLQKMDSNFSFCGLQLRESICLSCHIFYNQSPHQPRCNPQLQEIILSLLQAAYSHL